MTNETIASDPSKVNGSIGYGLDPVGNRLTTTSTISGINSGSLSFNPDDQVLIESYDADGNTTATGGKSFAYDSEDRLKSMNGSQVKIVYDGDGNRVAKTTNNGTTYYLVDDLNPTGYPQVVETTGATQRVYTYGLQRISEYQVINNAWTPSFYGYDGMGSVRQLTNAAGATTDTYEYDAFGNELNSTGTTPNEFLYRGEQYDSDLGLYYLRARYYNPLTGRFMSRDPGDGETSDPKTLHKYLYADGDPVDLADPTGKIADNPTMPEQATIGGSAILDYVVITLQVAATYEGVKDAGCAVEIAYYYLSAKFVDDSDITKEEGCKVKGIGRMLIQLQFGKGKSGITVEEVSEPLMNEDPPGVTLSQVGGGLARIWGAAQNGNAGVFPKSLNWDLKEALVDVSVCASRIVAAGGVIGGTKTVCQGLVGNSGWRVDLDQENGHNLTQ